MARKTEKGGKFRKRVGWGRREEDLGRNRDEMEKFNIYPKIYYKCSRFSDYY